MLLVDTKRLEVSKGDRIILNESIYSKNSGIVTEIKFTGIHTILLDLGEGDYAWIGLKNIKKIYKKLD